MVLRYVAEVPLSAVTKRVIDCFKSASIKEVAQDAPRAIIDKLEGLGINGEAVIDLTKEMDRIKDQLASIRSSSEAKRFVVNEESRVVHILTSCSGPTWTWSTRCGWAFAWAKSAVIRPDPDPLWPRCSTCFRHAGDDSSEG